MNDQKPKSALSSILGPVLFGVLFIVFIALAGIGTFALYPNLNGIGGIIISLVCAFPSAIVLLVLFKRANKFKWYITYVAPALIFPLLIGLFLGWTAFKQRPTNIFKVFVADPIPNGISNIRAQDISVGIDQEIVVTFNATPAAIDELIVKNKLKQVEDSYVVEAESPSNYFPDINWKENWTIYEESQKVGRVVIITIWVNPERNTVLFRYIYG